MEVRYWHHWPGVSGNMDTAASGMTSSRGPTLFLWHLLISMDSRQTSSTQTIHVQKMVICIKVNESTGKNEKWSLLGDAEEPIFWDILVISLVFLDPLLVPQCSEADLRGLTHVSSLASQGARDWESKRQGWFILALLQKGQILSISEFFPSHILSCVLWSLFPFCVLLDLLLLVPKPTTLSLF